VWHAHETRSPLVLVEYVRTDDEALRLVGETWQEPRSTHTFLRFGQGGVDAEQLDIVTVLLVAVHALTLNMQGCATITGFVLVPDVIQQIDRHRRTLPPSRDSRGLKAWEAGIAPFHFSGRWWPSTPAESAVADQCCGYASEGKEVLGFAFVAAVETAAVGLVAVPCDSGRRTGNLHRPERYSRRLRRVFYLSAQTSIIRDGPNRDYYVRKRAAGA
jgi:hypothetical protein